MPVSPDELRGQLDQALDFDKVLEQIAAHASFEASARLIRDALPYERPGLAKADLVLAKEAMDVERLGIVVNCAGISDITTLVQAAEKQMTLSPAQLIQIAVFLNGIQALRTSLDLEQIPTLQDLALTMDPCRKLATHIYDLIDLSGSVKEDATPALRSLHHKVLDTRARLAQISRGFLKANSSALMETITTSVSGRMCVLVKAQYKNSFGGMIHGHSQSGLACYIEPNSFVPLNNDLQELNLEIEAEKKRICQELSHEVAAQALLLISDLETAALLDSALAKGRWATVQDGCIPVFTGGSSHAIHYKNARHPLIPADKVVANDYDLKEDQYCLMISGPNMGGKTVTLKTIGLFTALAHAGFPVSAHSAALPWYDSLWFDIGDNQSIENSLSTFSAHMAKLSRIVSQAADHSFILLDEIGNGTDPAEGAALAASILENLMEKKSTVITSTHYSQVKSFGQTHPHILVSSVEFDGASFKPTYRYVPGVSGASYAFAVAQAFGLDPDIIHNARKRKQESESEVQRQLEQLEKMQNEVRNEKEHFQHLIADAHRLQKEADASRTKWEHKKEQLEARFEEELQEMLAQKEAQAQEIMDRLEKQDSLKLHEKVEYRHELAQLMPEGQKETETKKPESLQVGDYVNVAALNFHGEIVELKRNRATILTNGKKMQVKVSQLEKIPSPKPVKLPKAAHTDKVFKRFDLQLNIIGLYVEEGLAALDHYLDQAVYHKVKQVRIVHGMGTGKLRNAVWKSLAKHPAVKSYQAAGPSDGGLGATIVQLK